MALQNFVDKVGPVVSAAWLNMVDVLSTTVFANAATPAQARTALGILAAVKPGTTSRVNTATGASDPDLIVAIPGPGSYSYETMFSAWQNTTTTQGIGWGMYYTGTFNANPPTSLYASAGGLSGATAIASTPATLGFGIATSLPTFPYTGMVIMLKGLLIATSAGTFGLTWAQSVSSANATNVGPGYLKLTQLA